MSEARASIVSIVAGQLGGVSDFTMRLTEERNKGQKRGSNIFRNIFPEIMHFPACRCLLKILKHDFMQKTVA